jgi:hypothetical protein
LALAERILCLISAFSRNADSTLFKALLTPATPKSNSHPNSIPVIKAEDLLRRDKSFEKTLKLIGENLIKGRERKYASPLFYPFLYFPEKPED